MNSRMKNRRILFIVIGLGSFLALFFDYAYNLFRIVDANWFAGWQLDSENLVINSIEGAREYGIGYSYGLLGSYTKQIGLQGICFRILDFGINRIEMLISFYHILVVFCLCIVIFVFLDWARKEFGNGAAIMGYVVLFMNRWMIVSARNLYWVVFTQFLPFLSVLLITWRDEKKTISLGWFGTVAFLSIFVKVACGFEMISSVMISMEVPIFYFAYKNQWKWCTVLKRFFICAMGAITAFVTALIINFIQQVEYFGTVNAALNNIMYTINKRTGLFNTNVAGYQDSLEAKKWDILREYLLNGEPLVGNLHMISILWIITIATSLSFISKHYSLSIEKDRRKIQAISLATWVSLLGPASWYILASPHSYYHTHINYILWSFPCILLGSILSGCVISRICYDNKTIIKKLAFYVLLVVGLIFFYFYIDSCKVGSKYLKVTKAQGECVYDGEYADIYFYKDSLYYLISEGHEDKRIFFHLYPTESGMDYAEGYDFVNRDFDFESYEVKTPIWSKTKIARVFIPEDYGISYIGTGQFDETGREWEIYFSLEDYVDIPVEIVPDSLSDQNWTNGVSNDGFTVLMKFENALSIYTLEGKDLKTESGKEVKIEKVVKFGEWLHIILDEPIDVSEGYPHKLWVIAE